MKLEKFKRKNDIGVKIEYTVVAKYNDNGRTYSIYTDFVPDNSDIGIRLFVDEIVDGKYNNVPKDKQLDIINKMNKEIISFTNRG